MLVLDLFPKSSPLAIDPRALAAEAPKAGILGGSSNVVRVGGPLTYLPTESTVSYSAITAAVGQKIAEGHKSVILHVDSPGGDVAGAFDTARQLRAMCVAAGVKLFGYCDSKACSSGYAIISASERIFVSSTGELGSIGVISAMASEARALQARGIDIQLITSGARKADGAPMVPISEDAVAAAQVTVDQMAGEFFKLVAEHRGFDAQPLQAGVYVGAAAMALNLADEIAPSIEYVQKAFTSNTIVSATMPEDKDNKEDALRASLVTASESDDPEKAARAKRALAAYDTEEEEKEDKKEDSKAVAATASLAAQVQSLSAEITNLRKANAKAENDRKAAQELADRQAFMASRPDLNADLVKTLAALPLEQVKSIVSTIPKASASDLAAQPVVTPSAQSTGAPGPSDPSLAAFLDFHMGLLKTEAKNVETPYKQTFGVQTVVK